MTIAADSNGVVLGKFTIPANVLAGTKDVVFTGTGSPPSSARASFFGQGTKIDDVRQIVTQITTTLFPTPIDPIAQTFTLDESAHMDGIDLFFTVVGTTRVSVQIRETQVGFPTQRVLAESVKTAATITAGAFTTFRFRAPIYLVAGIEYAIVVLCNDAVSELAIAEIGKYDATAGRWITSQPYTVGVLLASSNASTWNAYQDRDLVFRLIARSYTESSHLVTLGTVSLTAATDLLLFAMMESPSPLTAGELQLTLPDSTVIKSGDYQRIQLPAATTGTATLRALLRADGASSTVLHPGAQIVHGVVQTTGTYITVATGADVTGVSVNLYVDAVVPSGATLGFDVSGTDIGDTYAAMTLIGSPKLLDGNIGLYEYHYQKLTVTEALVKIRGTITGTNPARPRVRNIRLIVT